MSGQILSWQKNGHFSSEGSRTPIGVGLGLVTGLCVQQTAATLIGNGGFLKSSQLMVFKQKIRKIITVC